MIQFTDPQRNTALRVIRDYRAGRDTRVEGIAMRRDQLEFMRYTNKMAKDFELIAPPMSFGELAELFVAFRNKDMGSSMEGIDFHQWEDLTPEDITAAMELCGCLLGLRRMAAGG